MLIRSLHLQNFQAHENLELVFSSNITTIVGPTDTGKSAVLRALRWICLNDISGDAFIREGAKRTTVQITIQGEKKTHTIIRIRGTSANTYELNGEEFKSFSSSVPDGIAQFLRLNDINFQSQHDAPFWFNETAGEVSRRLNAVIDLSVIDSALAFVASEVRTAAERKTVASERCTTAEKELADLEPQRLRIIDFTKLKELHETHTSAAVSLGRLEVLIEKGRSHSSNGRRWRDQAADGDAVLELGRASKNSAAWIVSLSSLLADAESLSSVTAPPPLTTLESLYQRSQTAASQMQTLQTVLDLEQTNQCRLKTNQGYAEAAEKKFQAATKNQNCPLCQNPLP